MAAVAVTLQNLLPTLSVRYLRRRRRRSEMTSAGECLYARILYSKIKYKKIKQY